jgi:hypothetical protein
VFGVKQDDDFAMYNTAPPAIIQAYNDGDGNGPDPDHLQLDMAGGAESQWNKAALGILLEKLKETRRAERWPLPDRSDSYLADLIRERYKRAAAVWQSSQRKTSSGTLETWEQVEKRLVAKKDLQLVNNRHGTRRRNVSQRSIL